MKKEKIDLSCLPDSKVPHVKEDFRKTFPWRIFKIMAEFIEGFEFITDFKEKSATIWGGTKVEPSDHYYKEAEKLGMLLAKQGYAVVSGGGPGIMEAANKGAFNAGGDSIGVNIELPEGQRSNKFTNKKIGFHYFFTRKVMMSMASSVYVFFPGGFGTLDEFFEMIVLSQTQKFSHKVFIVAVGKDYWQPLFDWVKKEIYEKRGAIDKEDLEIFKIVDSAEEAIEIIKKNN
jgi:uncharacterized protein (TIGR00730 family)